MSELMTEHDGCVNCMYEHLSGDEHPCKECKQNYTDKYKRKPAETIGDVIRKSNESLANELADQCAYCIHDGICTEYETEDVCYNGILAYLNQPESEE